MADEVIHGGISDARNPILMKMFNLIGIGEKAGSGFDVMRAGCDFAGTAYPELEVGEHPDRVTLTLYPRKIQDYGAVEGGGISTPSGSAVSDFLRVQWPSHPQAPPLLSPQREQMRHMPRTAVGWLKSEKMPGRSAILNTVQSGWGILGGAAHGATIQRGENHTGIDGWRPTAYLAIGEGARFGAYPYP